DEKVQSHAIVRGFTIREQCRKPPFAVAGEIDDAAARRAIARGPFQFGEARHHGGAQRAGEVMAPFAPVETGLAYRAARMRQHVGRYLQGLLQKSFAFRGQFDLLLFLTDQFLLLHAVEHLHAEIAGEMVVANPRPAQRRILRSRADAHMTGTRSEARKPFEHAGDTGAGETLIAMAALPLRLDQAADLEFRQMRTRGLRRDAGFLRELARGQRAAAHQRREHVGTRGIADQGGDHGDIGTCFHASTITEAFTTFKRLFSVQRLNSSLRGAIRRRSLGRAMAGFESAEAPLRVGGSNPYRFRGTSLDCFACARNDGKQQRRFPWQSRSSSATSSIRSSGGCSRNIPGAGSPSSRNVAAISSVTSCRMKAPTISPTR